MFKIKLINILILSVIPGTGLSASFTSNVDKGNKISNEVIDGIQNVSGIITNSMVITNGHQYINAGGSASHIVLNGGKSTVTDAAISSFKIISGIQNLESGAIANKTYIGSSGIQHVNNGAISNKSTLEHKGRQFINAGGKAEDTTVNTGGAQYVYAGGSSNITTINGGAVFVRGGTATNTTINSGKQVVTDGGTTSGDTINNGGYQNIGANGSAFNVTVNEGGRQDINAGGYAKDTTVIGGRYDIDPTAKGENVTFNGGVGYVFKNGILSGYAKLDNSASLYLAENSDADISLSNDSKLYVVNSLNTKNVALSDSSVHFHSPLDSTLSTEEFKTLNINKLESNNSSFYMNVEGMDGDFLNVTDFSGKNNIVNVAGSGKESSDGYHLIHAGNSTNDAFKLNGDKVELGSFVYTLEQKNDNWYLKQHSDQLSQSAKSALSIASYASTIFTNEYHTITDRLNNSMTDINGNQIWGRYIHNEYRVDNGVNNPYKLKQNGFEYGIGKTFGINTDSLNTGISFGITKNEIKEKSGSKSDVDSYSLGLYASYIKDNGFYLDALVKGNYFDSESSVRFNMNNIANTSFKQKGIGSAFEIGKQTNFNHSFITPYARIEYFSAKNKELKMTNGMKVKLGNDKSLKAEAGVKAGYTFDIGEKSTLTPYIKASFENEFINDNTVLINDTVKLKNDYSGSMGNYRVGLDARINKNTSLYTEASYSKGSMIESPLNINAGVRVFF